MEALSTAYNGSSIYQVLAKLICHGDIVAFPKLSKLAMILAVLPVTTATVKGNFSFMKLIKASKQNL